MSNVPSLLEDIQCCNMLPPSRRANWQRSTERDWAFDGDWHTYGSLAKEWNWRTGMARGRGIQWPSQPRDSSYSKIPMLHSEQVMFETEIKDVRFIFKHGM